MQIKCPSCYQITTTIPEALLGRIYVCAHCHRILRVDFRSPERMLWRPLAATKNEAPNRVGGKPNEPV